MSKNKGLKYYLTNEDNVVYNNIWKNNNAICQLEESGFIHDATSALEELVQYWEEMHKNGWEYVCTAWIDTSTGSAGKVMLGEDAESLVQQENFEILQYGSYERQHTLRASQLI